MNTVYIDKNTGIVCVIDSKVEFTDGTVFLHTDESVDPNSIYVEGGEIKFIPKAPENGKYVFNLGTKLWEKDMDAQWRVIRSERAHLLSRTDWTQLPDVPLATKVVWATYRQALRDITTQPDPFSIVWPTPPSN